MIFLFTKPRVNAFHKLRGLNNFVDKISKFGEMREVELNNLMSILSQ